MSGALPVELTSFVGRRRELGQVRRLLSVSRLVTVTGPGGVGKTRLVTRAAGEMRRMFPDGVRFVALAELSDPALLAQTVAAAFDLRDEAGEPGGRLADFLSDQQVLLVLDNCEHLAQACAVLVGKLLAAAAGLRVLATSRQRLHVEGEHLLSLEPLSDTRLFDAVSLFADRAAAIYPDFEITAENRAPVEVLCRKLDGLPLAIELAAAWLRTLTLEEIQDRLTDRFSLLVDETRAGAKRQRGLDALLEWSYRLCTPAERTAWARLSVFRGGFGLDAAEQICEDEGIDRGDVLTLVAALVDKSILVRQEQTFGRSSRYGMLATLADFGAARLADAGETAVVERRHRDFFQRLAREYAKCEFTADQLTWVVRLQREHPDVRRALATSLEVGDVLGALHMAADLGTFWVAGGRMAEGCHWLERLLDAATDDSVERARALHSWLILRTWLGVHESFRARLSEYRDLVVRLGNPDLELRLRVGEGVTTYFLGDPARARVLLEEIAEPVRACDDRALAAQALMYLTVVQFLTDSPEAESTGAEALAICDAHGRPAWHTAVVLSAYALTVWRRGDNKRAAQLQREALELRRSMNDHSGIAFSVETLAWCAAAQGDHLEAARLLGGARRMWRLAGSGALEPGLLQISRTWCEEIARDALGPARFAQAFEHGEQLDVAGVVAVALGKPATGNEPSPEAPPEAKLLTRREKEIASLVAEGLTNRQIAEQLVISQRTVESHVEHILTKLGFTSRTQIASWIASGAGD